jgi:TonB-dependent starch-binding outer membrane protein SusC
MNKFKQKLLWCFALIILCLAQINQTYAQENLTVKGTVVDENNDPLIGVSIGISGSQGGTRTDVNGNFQLQVPAKAKNLKFSYIGFDSKSVAISATMNVELKAASNTLDDVVVTGYQVQKKKDITSAVSNITSKDFNQGNVTNSILQIQGKVSGLSITQSTGNPNEAPTIRLRGQTSLYGNQNPLIVVDGIQLESADKLSNIPPGDIASYNVLKDASATSIYGSRGANGVIVITTKRGMSGVPKVEYQGFTAIDNQAKFRGLLSAEQWRAANPDQPFGTKFNDGGSTNWEKAMVRPAYTQSHTLGLSGGSKGFTYRGSVNYINQDNIIINGGKEQIGIRFNAEQKAFNDKLVLQLGLSNSITNRKNANGEPQKINRLSPAISIFKPNGDYNSFNLINNERSNNIVQRQKQRTDIAKENYSQYFGAAKLEVLPSFKVGVTGTMTIFNNKQGIFNPTYITTRNDTVLNTIRNRGEINTSGSESYRGEVNASYQKSFGKHNFDVFGLYEYNYFTNSSFNGSADNITYDFFEYNNLQASIYRDRNFSSERAESKLISLLGQLNYNYDNKFYIASSFRRDGSSKFGPNNRWANFVAVNGAWRISQEDFIKDILWINDLKIRAGYGQTGNQDGLSEYQFRRLRKVTGNNNPAEPNDAVTYDIAQNANADVQWETRNGRNIGLDFALLNSRLSGDFNYFNDITKKLLFEYETAFALPLPADKGRPAGQYVLANVGELSNIGLELALNYKAIQKKDFTWTVSGQISGVRTKIVKLVDASGKYTIPKRDIIAGKQNFAQDGELTYLSEGKVPFVFRLPNYLGLDTAGKQKIGTDTTYIDPSPRFNYGINNTLTFKNWSFSFFVRGVSGIKIYNSNAQTIQTNARNNMVNNGYNTTQQGLDANINDIIRVSDRWLENASFLRLDNATLAYTFKKIKNVSNLRLFVAANNLFVITKFSGLDPEVQNASSFSQGNTSNYLNNEEDTPRTRSFSFGINASF